MEFTLNERQAAIVRKYLNPQVYVLHGQHTVMENAVAFNEMQEVLTALTAKTESK